MSETQAGKLLERARADLGPDAVLETGQDLLASLHCPGCGADEPLFASLGKVTEARGRCPACGQMRVPNIYHTIDGHDRSVADRTLGELGVPPWDVVGARVGLRQRFYEFAGDRSDVLGPLETL